MKSLLDSRLVSTIRKGVWGSGPPKCDPLGSRIDRRLYHIPHVFEGTADSGTMFRTQYERGSLPAQIVHGALPKILWRVSAGAIDVARMLPLFIEGMREKRDPYRFVAVKGAADLVRTASVESILTCLPESMVMLKKALAEQHKDTMAEAVKLIIALTEKDEKIAKAMIPYYRLILGTLFLFRGSQRCTYDRVDFAELKRDGRMVGELIEDALNALEKTGGEEAFQVIKYCIPTWERCDLID